MPTLPLHPQGQLESLLSLCRRSFDQERGGAVFLAGHPGSGRSSLLRSLERELRRQKSGPTVVRARINADPEEAGRPSAADPAVRAVTGILSTVAAGAAVPLLGVLSGLVTTSVAARKLALAWRSDDDALELVPRTIRAAAQERELVLLIDDADDLHGGWWFDLMAGFAAEIAQALPVFFVFTVSGGAHTLGPTEPDDPAWLAAAKRLVRTGVAEWRPVEPVSEADVTAWIGDVRSDVIRRLVELTQGLAGVTEELWSDWCAEGIVVRSEADSQREFAPGYRDRVGVFIGDVVRRRLTRLIDDQNTRRAAHAILSCGALEGQAFTPRAVADALEMPYADVMALLEGQLSQSDRRPLGLVAEIAPVLPLFEHGAEPVRRFTLSSVLVWWSLRRFGLLPSEEPGHAAGLANALIASFGDGHPRFDHQLARLFRLAGDPERARHYHARGDHGLADDILRWEIREICEKDHPEWQPEDIRRAAQLLERGSSMLLRTGPLRRALTVIECRLELADRLADPRVRARAQLDQAHVLSRLGRADEAIALAEALVESFQSMQWPAQECSARALLAHLMVGAGRTDAAAGQYTEALALSRRLGDVAEEMDAQRGLGWLAWLRGDHDEAIAQLASVADHPQARHHPTRHMQTQYVLGWMHRLDGDLDAAEERLTDALRMSEEHRARETEAFAHQQLAFVHLTRGGLEAARKHTFAAVRIQARYMDGELEATSHELLTALGDVYQRAGNEARERGDATAAREHLAQALDVKRLAHGEHDVSLAITHFGLGRLAYLEGEMDGAYDQFARALELEDAAGRDDLQIDATLHWLSAVERRLGLLSDAHEHLTRAIEIRERQLGFDHADTRSCRHSLGHVLHLMAAEARDRGRPTTRGSCSTRRWMQSKLRPRGMSTASKRAWRLSPS